MCLLLRRISRQVFMCTDHILGPSHLPCEICWLHPSSRFWVRGEFNIQELRGFNTPKGNRHMVSLAKCRAFNCASNSCAPCKKIRKSPVAKPKAPKKQHNICFLFEDVWTRGYSIWLVWTMKNFNFHDEQTEKSLYNNSTVHPMLICFYLDAIHSNRRLSF